MSWPVSSCAPKDCRFDSWSGTCLGCAWGCQYMCHYHIDVSLSLLLPSIVCKDQLKTTTKQPRVFLLVLYYSILMISKQGFFKYFAIWFSCLCTSVFILPNYTFLFLLCWLLFLKVSVPNPSSFCSAILMWLQSL